MSDYLPSLKGGGIVAPFESENVFVGPTPDASIQVSKSTFSKTFVILSVTFTLGFFLIVFGVSFYV